MPAVSKVEFYYVFWYVLMWILVLEVSKKSGPMLRPLSKEHLSPEGHSPPPIEEDEAAHFDVSCCF